MTSSTAMISGKNVGTTV